eukprot:9478932-Pyramimonas_sp.AAC.1
MSPETKLHCICKARGVGQRAPYLGYRLCGRHASRGMTCRRRGHETCCVKPGLRPHVPSPARVPPSPCRRGQ